jgi:hypothetical protein
MLQAAKKEGAEAFGTEDIKTFSCEDLRIIDQLWLSASEGKFGFSVQKEIYESLGGTRDYNEEVWKKFGDRVGWRKGGNWLLYSDLTFNVNDAPKAQLPTSWGWLSKIQQQIQQIQESLNRKNPAQPSLSPRQAFFSSLDYSNWGLFRARITCL